MPVEKILKTIYWPYEIIIVIPLFGLSTAVFGISSFFIYPFLGKKKTSMMMGKAWARFNSIITPMFVTVNGRENIDPGQSYVIVSNHLSHFDIFALYGWLDIDFKWVMKQELRKVPVLGYWCDIMGHVYIDRSNREAALASLEEAQKRIVNGTSVLFFPEGTRSVNGKIQDFKKGAFKMALDLDIPILPVTIKGTEKILPARSMRLFPGKASLTISPPIPVNGYNDETIEELVSKSKKEIESNL